MNIQIVNSQPSYPQDAHWFVILRHIMPIQIGNSHMPAEIRKFRRWNFCEEPCSPIPHQILASQLVLKKATPTNATPTSAQQSGPVRFATPICQERHVISLWDVCVSLISDLFSPMLWHTYLSWKFGLETSLVDYRASSPYFFSLQLHCHCASACY